MLKDITAQDLHSILKGENKLVVLDVREREKWEKGHIIASVSVKKELFHEEVKKYNKDSEIVIICQYGPIGLDLCLELLDKGYENIYYLIGGLQAWHENRLPLTTI